MEKTMGNDIGTVTVKINADTSEFDAAIAGLTPSDYQIRLAALDRALGRDALLCGATDVIKYAHRFERYLRGDSTDE